MKNDLKNILNNGLTAMRKRAADPDEVENAASRVLQKLQAEHSKVVIHPASDAKGIERIQGCDDFRSLIPAYLLSSLTPSRRLLLEDHIHECVVCRKALNNFKAEEMGQRGSTPRPRVTKGLTPSLVRWAAAVSVAAALLIAFQTRVVRDFISPIDVHAMVQSVEGGLFSVEGQQVHPISAGRRIERSQVVRTGNASGAVLELADGSHIEMNARSEIFLDRARDGVRINLNRGDIIVTAAKQRDGHLYVATKEVVVSVVGTVFGVQAGVKGSRVAVIEGEVRVQQGQSTQPLRPGQQLSTDGGIGSTPVAQEIAWSRDAAKYLALLNLTHDVAQQVGSIEMRHTSDLVPLVPETTVVFASLPNISASIAQSYLLFKQRLSENPMLAEWWQQKGKGLPGPTLDEMVARIARVGNYLGVEVVFAIPQNVTGEQPVLLADTTAPDSLATALSDSGAHVARSISDVQAMAATKTAGFYVGDGLMIASPDANQILRSLRFRSQPALNSFASTGLYQRLVQAYTEGVGWFFAADLQRIGVGDLQQLVVEQKTGSMGPSYQALLAFNQNRRGIASWLASPAPMGALEFISPNAYGVAGVVIKDPALMMDDLLTLLRGDTAALQDFQNYQAQHRVDIRRDLAAPLGNELLIAVDGPILPTPAWKLVIEVNDAARLQNTIEWAIADLNREAAARQEQGLAITSESAGGRTFYSLTGPKFPVEIDYTFWAGYMIIAPSRALLLEAIQNHDSGSSLSRSASFRSQLPSDGHDYASGFVYQNLQAMAQSMPVDVIQKTPVNALPSLVCLYGEADRIVMSSKGVLGMNVASVAGITGMLDFTGLRGRH